jgi:hypothetical protein
VKKGATIMANILTLQESLDASFTLGELLLHAEDPAAFAEAFSAIQTPDLRQVRESLENLHRLSPQGTIDLLALYGVLYADDTARTLYEHARTQLRHDDALSIPERTALLQECMEYATEHDLADEVFELRHLCLNLHILSGNLEGIRTEMEIIRQLREEMTHEAAQG